MLVGFLMLWQGIGWAVTEFTIDGFTYQNYDGNTVFITAIPNRPTVKVSNSVSYNGVTYEVSSQIFGNIQQTEEDLKLVKDLYLYALPKSPYGDWVLLPNCPKGTRLHIPSSDFDTAKDKCSSSYIITDESRWYHYPLDPLAFTKDGFTYYLYYIGDETPYAQLRECPNEETVKIPLEVSDDRLSYPVKEFSQIEGDLIKNLYLPRVYASSYAISGRINNWKDINISKQATVHVPTEAYTLALDEAYAAKQYYYWVSDENRTARYVLGNKEKQLYAKVDGFVVKLNDNDGKLSATIADFEDQGSVRFPSEFVYDKQTYPVTGFGFGTSTAKTKIKEIHYSNVFCNSYFPISKDSYGTITIYVPDTLFTKATTEKPYNSYAFKKITDGKRWALNKTYHPLRSGYNKDYYYDVNGDGSMELFGVNKIGGNSYNSLFVSSLDGDTLNYIPRFAYNDFEMGLYNKEGFPLLTNSYATSTYQQEINIWDYQKNDWTFKSKKLYKHTLADINGDGLKEIIDKPVEGYTDFIKILQDGSFSYDKLLVTTDTTVVRTSYLDDFLPNSSSVYRPSTGMGSGVGSLADGMFVKSKENKWNSTWDDEEGATGSAKRLASNGISMYSLDIPSGYATATDMNGDGMIDLSDGNSIYYNLGNSTLFKSPHVGTIYSTDLTGNGLLDHIDFGNKQVDLYLNTIDGKNSTVKTLLKNTAISNVFFGDFDKDGDVDILFIIPGSNYLLFQYYRNDDNGVFKAKDADIDGNFDVIACNDYDNDGLYEVLVKTKNTEEYSFIKCNKNYTITEVKLPNNIRTIGDFNNDGTTEVASYGTYYSIYEPLAKAKANTRPEKMNKPSAVLFADAGKLKISWERGKDAETSSCDLTYELRIGSERGKSDIYFAKSNADGTRRAIEDGNMGRSLKYLFDTGNLSEGRYYIAIQAIDANGLGGAWSDELVYDHKLTAPVIAQLPNGYCTADTLTLSVQNPRNASIYDWNLSNGTIISQNANGSIITALFEKAGQQAVNLCMNTNGQTYKADTKYITLSPANNMGITTDDNKTYYMLNVLDLNQDGNAEFSKSDIDPYNSGGIFYENKNGTYSQLRKSWNSDLTYGKYYLPADFNHDGYPDFYLSHIDKGNMFINSGEEDKNFEYSLETFTFPSYNFKAIVDFNNNGKLGIIMKDGSLFNSEDERAFTRLSTSDVFEGWSHSINGFLDFDRDGALDIWENNTSNDKAVTNVYLKVAGENNKFNQTAKVFYENANRYQMNGFADFNNDGYVDGYFFDKAKDGNYNNLVIIKGKPMNEWPCTQTVVIPIKELTYISSSDTPITLLDFDNNGYLDILVHGNNPRILLMDKDFNYTEVSDTKKQFGINSNNIDEYHWVPLTRNAYPNGYKSNIKNEAPSAPTNVTATSIPEGLLLKWDDATDDHTPWMQMRYNVSLKIKGKTGENAFVLSPMNGLSDDAAICSGVYYRKASQLIVPKSALVNGTTYELQVQAIDLMGEHSPMTKPVEVTYNAENAIVFSESDFYQYANYRGQYIGNEASKYTIDGGKDSKVYYQEGSNFSIYWTTPGEKTIMVNADGCITTRTIIVKEYLNLDIELPKKTMLNTPIEVKVPQIFYSGKFSNYGFLENDGYKVSYEKGDSTAWVTFKEIGSQKLECFVKFTFNEKTGASKTTVIDETMPTAEIKSVESNGKYYQVNWSTAVPSMVGKVEISRETNRLNQFEVLDIVPVSNGSFVDLTSDNRVQPQRYRIRLIADNEMQMSDYSTPHNPLHVMINKTADKQGNKLMWNAYEGLDVQSYTILRGSSESNLKAIATIAGSQQNYTDYTAPEGVSYYAVKFETMPVALAKGIGTYAASDDVTSNVISSEEAMPTTAATNLYAGTVESNAKLTTDQQELHMVATILPTYVTYNKVSWSIVSGGEYASISQSGLLTAKGGKGDVVVRVVTLDGSNLSDEITIPCDVTIMAKDIDVRTAKKSIAVGDYLLLNAVLTPKNTTMSEVTWKSEDTDIATVDENGILKAITPGVVKITATTKDGSNLSAYINIIVTEPTGINGVIADDKDADTIYYDLEGKKIQTPTKGNIYITNKGKKVVF